MQYQKTEFDPNQPDIIAHSRVQVLASANWEGTRIPVFSTGIRINLSLMAAQEPWLRIHRSPDPFRVVKRSEKIVRLQHDWIWVEIATKELDALFAKAESIQPGVTSHL